MKNQYIQLVPADLSLAEQVVDYYKRNRDFLEAFEPVRNEEFFSLEYQQIVLKKEMEEYEARTAFRFYIVLLEQPSKIIGIIGLNNVIWGAFCSAFLGYKLDKDFVNKGYMSATVEMVTKYAFEELGLHRIEANVMPKNRASLRVLEKNQFINEGISKYYLNIRVTPKFCVKSNERRNRAKFICRRVTPKFCVKSNECRNRAKFICRRQRLDRLPPMSTT